MALETRFVTKAPVFAADRYVVTRLALFGSFARAPSPILRTDRRGGVELVYDSGSLLEQITASLLPTEFNANNEANGSFGRAWPMRCRTDLDASTQPTGLLRGTARA